MTAEMGLPVVLPMCIWNGEFRKREKLNVPGSGIDTEQLRRELEHAENRIRIAQMRPQ